MIITGFLLLLFVSPAAGEGTRTWEQSRFDDLTKGAAKGVAGFGVAPQERMPRGRRRGRDAAADRLENLRAAEVRYEQTE